MRRQLPVAVVGSISGLIGVGSLSGGINLRNLGLWWLLAISVGYWCLVACELRQRGWITAIFYGLIATPSIALVAFLPMFPFVLLYFLMGGRVPFLLLLLGLVTGVSVKAVTLLEPKPTQMVAHPAEPMEKESSQEIGIG